MCHTSVIGWAATAITPELITGRTVVEVGSYDVNGSVRPGIETHHPASYLGVDIAPGPRVDLVADVANLPAMYPEGFDLVVSTEMLEHVEDWRTAVSSLILLVSPGGSVAISTRSPGFPYHPYPIDMWRYPSDTMHRILTSLGMEVDSCADDPEAPGVFAIAHKPTGWALPKRALDNIEIPAP